MKERCQSDRIETLACGTIIQHGKYNNRIYLMKAAQGMPPTIPAELIKKAHEMGYTKIFVKIPQKMSEPFLLEGFQIEAMIPGFYTGNDACVFLAYCLCKERAERKNQKQYKDILSLACATRQTPLKKLPEEAFTIRRCDKADIPEMVRIYKIVFPSYPFPIDSPDYLEETMQSHVYYYCVEYNDEIVALSSAETDGASKSAEMTDFATLPDWRGNGLSGHLLRFMERDLCQHIQTAYTIARAKSIGMNITFARHNYIFSGRLTQNTHISGDIESMNVWYKKTSSSA